MLILNAGTRVFFRIRTFFWGGRGEKMLDPLIIAWREPKISISNTFAVLKSC